MLLVFLLILLIFWWQRRTIASDFIDRELARRGVQASYQIAAFGLGRQRLENVVIGDPAHPDLTARWVELRLSYGLRAPKVRHISASGVRLFGRLIDGKLSLGQIDKLLPPPTGAPFRLPDFDVALSDSAMRLDTPAGTVGMAIEGTGKLSDGFQGRIAAISRRLVFGDCKVDRPTAVVAVSVSGRRPGFKGPVGSARLACGGDVEMIQPMVRVDTTLSAAVDAWTGHGRIEAQFARTGLNAVNGLTGTVSVTGNSRRMRGDVDLAAKNGRFGDSRSGRLGIEARYDYPAAGALGLAGTMAASDVAAGKNALQAVIAPLGSVRGTPLEPLARALAGAVRNAGSRFDARAGFRLAAGQVHIAHIDASSRSGARLNLAGGKGVGLDPATGAIVADGNFILSGGGFPEITASLNQARAGAPLSGAVRMSPFAANGARLALADIRFAGASGGTTSFRTVATLDGPFSDGRVDGLVLPLSGRIGHGGFVLDERCTPAAFRALRYSSLQLGPTTLALCPIDRALLWSGTDGSVRGGAQVARLRLAGRLGSSPITIAADNFRFVVPTASFAGSQVAVRLGTPGGVHRLDLAALSGKISAAGVDGSFAGAAGKLANVALLLSDARGRWRVAGGRAVVDGAMTVSDELRPLRFHPLATKDFHLVLAGNRIDAQASLIDPDTGTPVARATIVHALDSGSGNARLDVPGIAFSDSYQPDQLTPLTVGVVALVNGTLRGEGRIVWNSRGTSSTGSFSTEKMNLAAPFGPVTGLTATINFSDLLGLQTGPGQIALVDRIQAGIDAFDGRVQYQLLPGLKVKVESGRWPFAGGELLLDETILDFSKESAKNLTFRVNGMDAATFVQQMEFGNISATGTFDGVVPMIFDQQGGRIVGGHLEARSPGGVVSYIGELTDKQLGTYGKLAFDALKSLRYSRLSIELNGALDGEFVAGVQLDGIARDTPSPGGVAGYAISQLAKIPFEFNITARGPFRALISMMRSFDDPSGLIQPVLPARLRDQPTSVTIQPRTGDQPAVQVPAVQPQESETMR